jgi:hypothetical protein
MTPLETILFFTIWIFVGCFICVKRNWYKNVVIDARELFCIICIVFAPISLIIAIFRELIIDEWNNKQ